MTWHRQLNKKFPILQSQYHGCWCPGDARSQDISIHDIYYAEPDWFGLCALRVKTRKRFISPRNEYSLIVALWHHMVLDISVNIASGNDLCLFSIKLLPEQMLDYCNLNPKEQTLWYFQNSNIYVEDNAFVNV